jgi:ankyrin repeat protein
MEASGDGHTDVVALLLAHGCGNIDHRDLEGWTALHHACRGGRAGVARALLVAGADPHVVDRLGETPLAAAVGLAQPGCVAELGVRSVVL